LNKPTPADVVTASTKAEINAELFAMASQHLSSGPWPGDQQTGPDMWRTKLINMKLVEPVEPDVWRNTALGNEVCVDVVKVFLGVWATTEVATVLHRRNLMSEQEMREIWAREDAGERPEDMLPLYVHRAFRQFFKIPATTN
jgi:methylglyoxal synthase